MVACIAHRVSIRKYEDRPVERDKTEAILRAGYETGRILLTVAGEGLPEERLELDMTEA